MTTAPDMLMEFGGSPVGGGRFSSPWAKHYFVDAIDGSAGNAGLRPDDATKTIQQAVDLATGGDIIYIRPQQYKIDTMYGRYQEDVTITMTAGLTRGDIVVDGMRSIIGVSANTFNADFSGVRWQHASTCNLTNDTPGLHVENIGFFSEGCTYGVLLRYEADTKRGSEGTSFYHCAFKAMGLYVRTGGDGLTIDSCRFQPKYDGTTVADINLTGTINLRRTTIRNCEWLDGNSTASVAPCITIAGTTSELLIRDCYFPKKPSGGVYINTSGAVHGLIANCFFSEDDLDTDAEILQGTGVKVVGCYDALGLATT
jgi:hypothetical protein